MKFQCLFLQLISVSTVHVPQCSGVIRGEWLLCWAAQNHCQPHTEMKERFMFLVECRSEVGVFFFRCTGSLLCERAFSNFGERGLLLVAVHRLRAAVAYWLQSVVSRAQASAAVGPSLSCSMAGGIFSDQGSNPGPLNWWSDSRPGLWFWS